MHAIDPEILFTGALRTALRPAWPGLTVDRARRSNAVPMVTLQRAGGAPTASGLLDQARLLVNIYAATEADANRLADATRGALEALARTHPVRSLTVTGPSAVTDQDSLPQRFLQADAVIRRTA